MIISKKVNEYNANGISLIKKGANTYPYIGLLLIILKQQLLIFAAIGKD
jgi:hypothetical protein